MKVSKKNKDCCNRDIYSTRTRRRIAQFQAKCVHSMHRVIEDYPLGEDNVKMSIREECKYCGLEVKLIDGVIVTNDQFQLISFFINEISSLKHKMVELENSINTIDSVNIEQACKIDELHNRIDGIVYDKRRD